MNFTRRQVLLAGGASAVSLAAGSLALSCRASSPVASNASETKPNVIFISIDDMNDWIAPLGGHPQVKTPHLDRLAARGVTFTNAHCQAPLCNPSRASYMTSLRPTTTGIYALNPWFRTVESIKGTVTLPQHLHGAGYLTAATGKTYHDGYPPKDQREGEFDVWGFDGGFSPRPPKKMLPQLGNHPLIDWGVFPDKDEDQDDWKVASWAIEQIQAPRTQPMFLAAGLRHPHLPCFASQKWFDLYPEETLKLPPIKEDDLADVPKFSRYLHWNLPEPTLATLKKLDLWKSMVRAYLASVSFMDSQIGRILDAVDQSPAAKNTIIVALGDNGFHLGEKGMTAKTTLWERSTRVPLLIAGPGIKAGGRCNQPAELLDVYPTLIDLCGVSGREGLEGQSLLPQLRDPSARRERPAITTHGPGNHAVRSEGFRYIRYADGSEELYDMAADPKLADTKRQLAAWLPKTSVPPAPGSKARLITYENGVPVWEGKAIAPTTMP